MRPEVITVGTSLGGLHAITTMLRGMPANLQIPILIVQHRGTASDEGLVTVLQDQTALTVVEAEDKVPLAAGTVYIAAPDYHLLVEAPGEVVLSTDAPLRSARPSIDVLFETAAQAYGAGVLGVLLTGASADGASGLARIKALGGRAIVQDPATAECATMPAAGIAATSVDYILPLESIGEYVVTLVEGTRA